MVTLMQHELERRLDMLNALLTSTECQLRHLVDRHLAWMTADPDFYGQLASWYLVKGTIRDHQNIFAAMLLTGDSKQYRDAGYMLIQKMPPSQLQQVIQVMKRYRGKVPRSTRHAVEVYLRFREADPARFDRAVARSRQPLKSLYAGLHIKPSARADAILFKQELPEVYVPPTLYAARDITGLSTGREQIVVGTTQAGQRIRKATALLVDKSGSMSEAIAVGKQLAKNISAIMEAPFMVYAFDAMPYLIQPRGRTPADWDRAFELVQPYGCTSTGAPLALMRRQGVRVEQIVIVTDEGENAHPYFLRAYEQFCQELSVRPNVVIVRIGRALPQLTRELEQAGVEVASWPFMDDYDALSDLIPMLMQPSRLDLLQEIMATALPVRQNRQNQSTAMVT